MLSYRTPLILAVAVLVSGTRTPADAAPPGTDAYLDETRARWEDTARKIWGFHEVALEERQSSALLADLLAKEGFAVQRGVAGMPTAFVARAGKGEPVVALLAEYDALPELSQAAGATTKQPMKAGAPGHGCGHNLLGLPLSRRGSPPIGCGPASTSRAPSSSSGPRPRRSSWARCSWSATAHSRAWTRCSPGIRAHRTRSSTVPGSP